MRGKLVGELNQLLEIDHDAIVSVMTAELRLACGSDLNPHPVATTTHEARIVTALQVINHCIGGDPIRPVWEDGGIQRFE